MIWIIPIENKIKIRKEQIANTLKLKNDINAIYSTTTQKGFNMLIFEKDEWQYILNVDKRISNVVTQDVLLDIANSIP